MTFVLSQTLQQATVELAEFYNKDKGQIDADTLLPYLVLIVIHGVSQSEQDFVKRGFLTRLVMAEFFTVREGMFGSDYYAFASFRNVE